VPNAKGSQSVLSLPRELRGLGAMKAEGAAYREVACLAADFAELDLRARRRAMLVSMAPPFDHPLHAPEPGRTGHGWLDLLTAELDAATPVESTALRRREEQINHELDEIEAGRHPLCHVKPAA
jgi:hypothetical protein